MKNSVNNILEEKQEFGQSKWSSLQFIEKIMKGILSYYNIDFEYLHDLDYLSGLLEDNNIVIIPKNLINLIDCRAKVRYQNDLITIDDAINAHHASLEILELLIENID